MPLSASAGGGGAVLRPEGGGAGDRAAGGAPHRQPRAQKPADAGARGARLRRHLLFRRAVSADRAGGRPDRLCRRARRLARFSGRRRTWRGGKRLADGESLLGEELPEHARPDGRRAAAGLGDLAVALARAGDCGYRPRRARPRLQPRSARSSRRWRWSPSAALTPCSPTWRSRRSRLTAG